MLPDESMRKLAAAAAASTSGRSRAPSGGTLFPSSGNSSSSSASPSASGAATTTTTSRLILPGGGAVAPGHSGAGSSSSTARFAYPPAERSNIRESWGTLMRWSKVFRTKQEQANPLDRTRKVVVFGGGSFGTAMGCSLAHQKEDLDVVLLVRDPYLCKDINQLHCNTRYLKVSLLEVLCRVSMHGRVSWGWASRGAGTLWPAGHCTSAGPLTSTVKGARGLPAHVAGAQCPSQ